MESVAMTEGSFVTFWNIARAKHPYSDSKFVKKCIVLEYRLYWNPNAKGCPKKKKKSCLCRTAQRRLSQISAESIVALQCDLKSLLAYSLAFDESTDIRNNPQLVVFVRYISSDMFKQELLNAVTLREANCGIDIKNTLNRVLTNAHVPLNILVSIATSNVGLRPIRSWSLS